MKRETKGKKKEKKEKRKKGVSVFVFFFLDSVTYLASSSKVKLAFGILNSGV